MRLKDDNKAQAIAIATIKIVNQKGLVNVSMSKIAKAARVPTASLYTYFQDKEDLLRSVYIASKTKMLQFCQQNFQSQASYQQNIRQFLYNLVIFIQRFRSEFLFIEQLANSPFNIPEQQFIPLLTPYVQLFEQGIEVGELKALPVGLLMRFCFYAVSQLYKEQCQHHKDYLGCVLDFEAVWTLCWDAIKK